VPLDFSLAKEALEISSAPDVLLLPSDLAPFVKVIIISFYYRQHIYCKLLIDIHIFEFCPSASSLFKSQLYIHMSVYKLLPSEWNDAEQLLCAGAFPWRR